MSGQFSPYLRPVLHRPSMRVPEAPQTMLHPWSCLELLYAQRLEASSNLLREDLWLFPGRKVATLIDLVVVDELGECPLRPTTRGRIELVRKDAHGDRDGDALDAEIRKLVLPVEAGRRKSRVRQPGERDVVEDVVSRET